MNEKMTDESLQKLLIFLHRPIPWDPIPWWIKLDKEKVAKFNDLQTNLNTKIAEIQAQKIAELSKIAGMKI